VVEAAIGEEFNLASGRETRIVDLATWINEAVGNPAGINFAPRRIWDTKRRLCASVDKARALIGYAPDTEFQAGLAQTIQWFRDNWDRIDEAASFGPGISSAVRQMTVQAEPSR
jgi:UDP-glucose 4-epimerase